MTPEKTEAHTTPAVDVDGDTADGDVVEHVVSRWHWVLDEAQIMVPHTVCGASLIRAPGHRPLYPTGPVCPRCAPGGLPRRRWTWGYTTAHDGRSTAYYRKPIAGIVAAMVLAAVGIVAGVHALTHLAVLTAAVVVASAVGIAVAMLMARRVWLWINWPKLWTTLLLGFPLVVVIVMLLDVVIHPDGAHRWLTRWGPYPMTLPPDH